MNNVGFIMVVVVAIVHAYLLYVEVFAWTTKGRDFLTGLDPKTFPPSVVLAKNMGVYNGFLAGGLLWSLAIKDPHWATEIAVFFLAFIAIAGVVGARTADWKLFWLQSVPALLAIGGVFYGEFLLQLVGF